MKIIFITGAASGFGKSAAETFFKNGYKVIATDKDEKKLEELPTEIIKHKMDVTKPEEIKKVISEVIEKYGIDILVNNAGYGQFGLMEGLTKKQIEEQFAVNVIGLINVTNEFLPKMREQKSGRIINISSMVGISPAPPKMGIYSASKAAVEAISDAYMMELDPFNIKVIRINPSLYKTNFMNYALENMSEILDDEYPLFESFKNNYYKRNEKAPLPDKVADSIYKAATVEKPKTRYLPNSFERNNQYYLDKSISRKKYVKNTLKKYEKINKKNQINNQKEDVIDSQKSEDLTETKND